MEETRTAISYGWKLSNGVYKFKFSAISTDKLGSVSEFAHTLISIKKACNKIWKESVESKQNLEKV
jgi:hypothetical protein